MTAVAAGTLTVSGNLTAAANVAGVSVGNADLIYAARGNNLFIRTAGGVGGLGFTALPAIAGAVTNRLERIGRIQHNHVRRIADFQPIVGNVQ